MNNTNTTKSPIPDQLDKKYFKIAQRALDFLNYSVDGNGLKIGQISLKKEKTKTYRIEGALIVELTPKISQDRKNGRIPYGEVLDSKKDVLAITKGLQPKFLKSGPLHRKILAHLKKSPDQGWSIKPAKISVPEAQKEFSVIEKCEKCEGRTRISCIACNASGTIPCKTCYAKGMIPCQTCRSAGYTMQDDGSQISCLRCKGLGRVICPVCRNIRNLPCTLCGGKGSVGCSECGQSGFWTHTYSILYEADVCFELFEEDLPPIVQKSINKLGIANLGVKGHADIFYWPVIIEKERNLFPLTAILPIASAEFSIKEKIYPAVIAGLNARIIKIEPFMDALIKPGINALFALTKKSKEPQTLIDKACKYRILQQTLSNITKQSKSVITKKIINEYPEILSKKYAKASVKYADMALLTLGKNMRIKGLLIGIVLSYGLSLLYYIGPVKAQITQILIQKNLLQYALLADALVWFLGYITTIYIIKIMASHTLRKFLPDISKGKIIALPSAGIEGIYALGTTLLAFFAANIEFLTALSKKLGL